MTEDVAFFFQVFSFSSFYKEFPPFFPLRAIKIIKRNYKKVLFFFGRNKGNKSGSRDMQKQSKTFSFVETKV